MPLIRPFTGLRPAPAHAADVVAPPYDVLSSAEARARAAGKPWSFLHISKPEIDLPPDTDPYSPDVYAKGLENLSTMVAQGILQRDARPYYYLYQLIMGTHTKTGLVAAASVAAYEQGRICKHEFTRPDKEDDRVRQIDALNAQTGPVMLTYRHTPAIDTIVAATVRTPPEFDITADDGIYHRLWVVRDENQIALLSKAFEAVDYLYIADGHHRCAAAARVAASRGGADDASHQYFLAVIFSDNQMQILDYNRVIRDLNGLSAEQFLKRLGESFTVELSGKPVKPAQAGEFGMYLSGQWYRLSIRAELIPQHDPVARLDVSLLADYCIAPVLGINDPRRDKRIDFVGGIRGLAELEKRVDSGDMAVAFALFPTSMSDLMAVSDSGEVMPPKSTWFEPKLGDGLVSQVLD